MTNSAPKPASPAAYYRRHAARIRGLANEAISPGIKEDLRGIALQYDRLAERVEDGLPDEI